MKQHRNSNRLYAAVLATKSHFPKNRLIVTWLEAMPWAMRVLLCGSSRRLVSEIATYQDVGAQFIKANESSGVSGSLNCLHLRYHLV